MALKMLCCAGERVAIQRSLEVEGVVVSALLEVGVIALYVLLSNDYGGRGVQGLRRPLDEAEGLDFVALHLDEVPLHLAEFVRRSEDRLIRV